MHKGTPVVIVGVEAYPDAEGVIVEDENTWAVVKLDNGEKVYLPKSQLRAKHEEVIDKFFYMKPCKGSSLETLTTALWQRTNGVERVLGIPGPTPFCPQFPEPGAIGLMEMLCERWTKILALLEE